MTESTADWVVGQYLRQVGAAMADIEPQVRASTLTDLEARIRTIRGGSEDLAEVQRMLREVGSPGEIAAAAAATDPARGYRSQRQRAYDRNTVLIVALGGLPPAWVVGTLRLWLGPRWTVVDRIIGTLAWPLLGYVTFAALDALGQDTLLATVIGTLIVGCAIGGYLAIRAARSREVDSTAWREWSPTGRRRWTGVRRSARRTPVDSSDQ